MIGHWSVGRSFASKIWLLIVSWVFMVLLIFGGILAKATHDFYYGYADEENEELTDTAMSLASYLAMPENASQEKEQFAFLGKMLKYDLIAVDSAGRVYLSTNHLKDWTGMTMPGEDMEKIRLRQTVSFQGNAPYTNEHILKVATPILKDGQVLGAVFVVEPLTYLNTVGRLVNRSVSWGLTLSFVLALPVGFFLARRVANPVVEMDRAVKNIAIGNYSTALPQTSSEELVSLGQSVNALSEEIQQQLQESTREKQQLANILTSMEDGVLTISAEQKILIVNRVALAQFAAKTQENLRLGDLAPDLQTFLLRALAEMSPQEGEFSWQGQIFRVESSVLLTSQECGGVVAVWHNITKEKQLESLRREFVANVSHELRTPLSYLQGYSEALLDGVLTDESQHRRYLETIHSETLRLRRLVNDLLDLNRLEYGGAMEVPHDQVNVADSMETICRQLAPAALAKEVKIIASISPDLPDVDCGQDRFKQILLNLVDNALHFSPTRKEIILSARSLDKWVEISVTDQGPGIPLEEQGRIWDRFERGHHGQEMNSGMGLGLAIVRSLVLAYGGEVYLSSQLGQGATFSFRLPSWV